MIFYKVIIPTLFKSDGDIAIASVPLYVRPSVTLSPPKPLDEIQPNLVCVCCSHEWGVQWHIFWGPALWGPGEGPKDQILLSIMKFQLQSQFQRFLNQTLCVYSQMRNIKHIRQDFHSAAWVMPQGWDLGVPWVVGGVKKNSQRHNFSGPRPLGPLGGVKYH